MWKKSTYTALLLTVCLTACFSWGNVNGQRERFSDIPADRPNLVVGIVVDQMRWDYLYRYAARYGEGGFKRLLREGFSCENTLINHLPSATAVGHATIYTGSVPAISGIVGNEWIDQHTGRKWYCTEDTRVRTVGASSKAGEMSYIVRRGYGAARSSEPSLTDQDSHDEWFQLQKKWRSTRAVWNRFAIFNHHGYRKIPGSLPVFSRCYGRTPFWPQYFSVQGEGENVCAH